MLNIARQTILAVGLTSLNLPLMPSLIDLVQVSFQELLQQVPADNQAGKTSDLSVHLCFICLLHLANEHGLAITGSAALDSMAISGLPEQWQDCKD